MKSLAASLGVWVAATFVTFAHASTMSIVAYDSANLSSYAPQPTHNYAPINGGYGYGPWTVLTDCSGGGTFMEGVGVDNRQVDGNYSFALYAGSGSFDISRPLLQSLIVGEFTVLTRFDLEGTGPSLVSIRAGNNTASFPSGELLSFGIVNGDAYHPADLTYTDGTGLHVLPSGESRGDVWSWTVDFNASAGTYSASVTNLGGGYTGNFSGSLESGGASVGSFAVINSSTGNNQNVIFDSPTFSTPEPATLALLTIGGMAILRRKR